MNNQQYEWLPHLNGVIPIEARHNRTSLYTIALEGWRRGLTLSFHNELDEHNKRLFTYSLQSDERIHYFDESSGDHNTPEAFHICNDKALTSKYLLEADVPIPLGKKFSKKATIEEMLTYAKQLTYPLVIKPTAESSGRGVMTNISDEATLKKAIKQLKERHEHADLIVQEHVHGDEIRIYVLEGEVIAATNRVPANVVGDGVSTITQLIHEKNKRRKEVPHLYFRPIVVDSVLRNIVEKQGFTLETILPKDKCLFVREVSNISTGGDPIDVTDELTEKQKNIAIAATKAIPGLAHCGVDMIVPEKSNSGVILELNTRPGIGSHLFPIQGKARDIPKKIIDYYFPETKNVTRNDDVYFDLQTVFDGINNGHTSEIEMKPCPEKKLHAYKWHIQTELDVISLYSYVRKIIIDHQFSGYFKSEAHGKIEMLIAHENIDTISYLKTYIQERHGLLRIKNLTEEKYTKPIQVGFKIIDGLQQMSLHELERIYHENLKELRNYELSVQRLERRIELMKKSSSWKLTKPLRTFMEIFKK